VPFDQNYAAYRNSRAHVRAAGIVAASGRSASARAGSGNSNIGSANDAQALQGVNGFFFVRFGAQLPATMGLLGLILAVAGVLRYE
jgi:hypothetical protein